MYACEADLDRVWGVEQVDLIAFDKRLGGRDGAKITAALDDAGAILESYCGRRYALPLDLAPGGLRIVAGYVCDIAVGRLATSAGRMTEIIQRRADAALAWAKDVAAGKADLPVAVANGAPPASEIITPNEGC